MTLSWPIIKNGISLYFRYFLLYSHSKQTLTATTPVGEAVQVQEGNLVFPSPCSEGFYRRLFLVQIL